MAQCNNDISNNLPKPRTCGICGLGPCKNTAHRSSSLKHIAGLLQELSYRDMKALADIFDKHDDMAPRDMAALILKIADEILAS